MNRIVVRNKVTYIQKPQTNKNSESISRTIWSESMATSEIY